jgi:SAM-dependent methyltransferase
MPWVPRAAQVGPRAKMLAMSAMKDHWEHIYRARPTTEAGWYEADPALSRHLVGDAVAAGASSVIDVGGGSSYLVDHLLDLGLERVAVVDISEAGVEIAKRRLGARAKRVRWIVGDISQLDDVGTFDVWHDRAVFHFLLDPAARQRYVALSERTVPTGGTAVMATFAEDGPDRCSGLPVRRYSEPDLVAECGPGWDLIGSINHLHTTPRGAEQRFRYSTFRRV